MLCLTVCNFLVSNSALDYNLLCGEESTCTSITITGTYYGATTTVTNPRTLHNTSGELHANHTRQRTALMFGNNSPHHLELV